MFEITTGAKAGEKRSTENGARMTVINCPEYDASSYPEADEYIREVGGDSAEGNQEPAKGPEGTGGTHPAEDQPDPQPRETPTEPECPECGGNRYFDASEHVDYQFGCPDCSTASEWVVWDE